MACISHFTAIELNTRYTAMDQEHQVLVSSCAIPSPCCYHKPRLGLLGTHQSQELACMLHDCIARTFFTISKLIGRPSLCFAVVVSFSKNGEWLGDAFSIPRITGLKEAVYPHLVLKNAQASIIFSGSRMNGYEPWQVGSQIPHRSNLWC